MSNEFFSNKDPDGFVVAMDRRPLKEQIKLALVKLFGSKQPTDTTASEEQGRIEESQELSR